eukprot:scaffold15106_cov65-Isochrysis_galbana.AAC.1
MPRAQRRSIYARRGRACPIVPPSCQCQCCQHARWSGGAGAVVWCFYFPQANPKPHLRFELFQFKRVEVEARRVTAAGLAAAARRAPCPLPFSAGWSIRRSCEIVAR